MHVFVAGVMQGSRLDDQIDDQNYRVRIAEALRAHLPDARVTDPWTLYPDSPTYDDEQCREVFLRNTALAGESDVLIAYLPHASMGTAIELWAAYHSKSHVIAVTPMAHNWVVRVTADEVLPDLDSLLTYIESGNLRRRLEARQTGQGSAN